MNGHKVNLEGLRVLVADDEPFNLSIVVRMMHELGCKEIVQAPTGQHALNALEGHGKMPMFAILDFNMPDANGLQILKQVRTGKTSAPRGLHILMLTGSSDFGLVGAAMGLDVDAFIIKPVSLVAMDARLEKVLEQGHTIKAIKEYEQVDIDSVSQRLLSRKPVGLANTKRPAKKINSVGLPVRLESARAGTVLAEEVRGPNGELLLGRATLLTDRLIRRLQELQAALKIDYIYVFPPAKEKSV